MFTEIDCSRIFFSVSLTVQNVNVSDEHCGGEGGQLLKFYQAPAINYLKSPPNARLLEAWSAEGLELRG